jgi:hypothetical protein
MRRVPLFARRFPVGFQNRVDKVDRLRGVAGRFGLHVGHSDLGGRLCLQPKHVETRFLPSDVRLSWQRRIGLANRGPFVPGEPAPLAKMASAETVFPP